MKCDETNPEFHASCTGFLQIYIEKKVIIMNATGFLAYLVHVLIFFVSHSYRQKLLKNVWYKYDSTM